MLLQLHSFVLLLSLTSAIKVIEQPNPRLIGSSAKLLSTDHTQANLLEQLKETKTIKSSSITTAPSTEPTAAPSTEPTAFPTTVCPSLSRTKKPSPSPSKKPTRLRSVIPTTFQQQLYLLATQLMNLQLFLLSYLPDLQQNLPPYLH